MSLSPRPRLVSLVALRKGLSFYYVSDQVERRKRQVGWGWNRDRDGGRVGGRVITSSDQDLLEKRVSKKLRIPITSLRSKHEFDFRLGSTPFLFWKELVSNTRFVMHSLE